MLSMPSNWVYVVYNDGTEENVMNTDALDDGDIEWCKENWAKKPIDCIELRDNRDNVLLRRVI